MEIWREAGSQERRWSGCIDCGAHQRVDVCGAVGGGGREGGLDGDGEGGEDGRGDVGLDDGGGDGVELRGVAGIITLEVSKSITLD